MIRGRLRYLHRRAVDKIELFKARGLMKRYFDDPERVLRHIGMVMFPAALFMTMIGLSFMSTRIYDEMAGLEKRTEIQSQRKLRLGTANPNTGGSNSSSDDDEQRNI